MNKISSQNSLKFEVY